jgi:hypothetical protein
LLSAGTKNINDLLAANWSTIPTVAPAAPFIPSFSAVRFAHRPAEANLRAPLPQPPRFQAPPPRPLLRLHFSKGETQHLLQVIEAFLPIGPDEWELVVAAHADHLFNTGRTSDSVRREFNGLTCNKKPTGDPTIPLEFRKAKKITFLIFKRSVATVLVHTIVDDDNQPQRNRYIPKEQLFQQYFRNIRPLD